MEILKKRSYLAVLAMLLVLSGVLIDSSVAAAYSAPATSAPIADATVSAAHDVTPGAQNITLAVTGPNPAIQSAALPIAQDDGDPLTIDDCYIMMATLSLTGTPTLMTTVDDAGAPVVSCGGILTAAPAKPTTPIASTPIATVAPVAAAAPLTATVATSDTATVTGSVPLTDTGELTGTGSLTETEPVTVTAGPYTETAPTVATIPGHGVPGQSWKTINPGYKQPTNFPVRGFSTYYNPGVMEQVVSYRTRVGDITPCPECIGEVALVRAGDINRRIWLQLDDTTVEGPFLVTDCAHTWDVGPLVRRGWGVDLDYDTAARWDFDMRVVTILDEPPADWAQDPAIALATGATMPAAPAAAIAATTTDTARLAMRPPTP